MAISSYSQFIALREPTLFIEEVSKRKSETTLLIGIVQALLSGFSFMSEQALREARFH